VGQLEHSSVRSVQRSEVAQARRESPTSCCEHKLSEVGPHSQLLVPRRRATTQRACRAVCARRPLPAPSADLLRVPAEPPLALERREGAPRSSRPRRATRLAGLASPAARAHPERGEREREHAPVACRPRFPPARGRRWSRLRAVPSSSASATLGWQASLSGAGPGVRASRRCSPSGTGCCGAGLAEGAGWRTPCEVDEEVTAERRGMRVEGWPTRGGKAGTAEHRH